MTAPALEVRGVRKSFGQNRVLDDVNIEVLTGEIHALLGGNGAGKSILMKILSGVYTLDEGTMLVNGQRRHFSSAHDAQACGIATVFQKFSLIPTLTVAQNISLATGGNEAAARFSGVNTRRIKLTVLIISGLSAALAGMLYAGRLQSGWYQWGAGDELSVIAAVVIGGTSLFGGTGSVMGAVVGSLLVGLINNGLILMGLQSSQQIVARSVLIILAVALTGRRNKT